MKLRSVRINDEHAYTWYEAPDCNLINPINHFAELRQTMIYGFDFERVRYNSYYNSLSPKSRIEFIGRLKAKAKREWDEEYQGIIQTPLFENLNLLLQESKKKAQQKLLKGMTFTSEMFISIPIHAWISHKMRYSKVVVDYLPKEYKDRAFPQLLHLDYESDDDPTIVGYTDMSNAELRAAMRNRNRVISEFIGDEQYWHCFFRTMSGIRGREQPHIGEPHLHYISSAWGITRKDVIENLSSYRYSLKAETIPFEYRDDYSSESTLSKRA